MRPPLRDNPVFLTINVIRMPKFVMFWHLFSFDLDQNNWVKLFIYTNFQFGKIAGTRFDSYSPVIPAPQGTQTPIIR